MFPITQGFFSPLYVTQGYGQAGPAVLYACPILLSNSPPAPMQLNYAQPAIMLLNDAPPAPMKLDPEC